MSDDSENRAVHEFATKAEKDNLQKLVDNTLEWLGDHAETADEKTLKGKRAELE